MKVLLRKDVEGLGKRGDMVQVREGYARNYLLPQRLATAPSAHATRELEAEKRRAEKLREVELADMRSLAQRVEDSSCTLEVRANEEGVLFGSVSAQMIAAALEKEGLTVEPKAITLEAPIKELGVYTVPIRLEDGIEAACRFWVVEERAGDSAEASEP